MKSAGNNFLVPMGSKFPYRLCEVKTRENDLSKRWYVEYYVWDVGTEKLERMVDYISQKNKTIESRLKEAKRLIKYYNDFLEKGAYINSKLTPEDEEKKEKEEEVKKYSILKAINFACTAKSSLAERTTSTYESAAKIFIQFLTDNNYSKLPVHALNHTIVEEFFIYLNTRTHHRTGKKLSNRTKNNYKANLTTLLNYLKSKKIINSNFMDTTENLRELEVSHVVYSDKQIQSIKELLLDKDPQLWVFCRFIYFLFIRPNEGRFLRIRNIRGNKILVPASIKFRGKEIKVSKNNRSEWVTIPKSFLPDLLQYIDGYPPDYFIFSTKGKPGAAHVGKSNFINRYRLLTKKIGISNDHTLYSFKHNGVIALYNAIKDLERIRQQCRHQDIKDTAIYLRQLGCFENTDVEENFPGL